MKKLIKLSETHYIVVDDSEIKKDDWVYDFVDKEIFCVDSINEVSGIVRSSSHTTVLDGCKKITHSTQPLESKFSSIIYRGYYHISLSEVEEAIYGYKNKFLKFFKNEPNYKNYWKPLIEDNPQLIEVHKELVKDKVFTIEDMKLFAAELIGRYKSGKIQEFEDVQDIIESYLPKIEWECCISDGKIKLI